MKKITDFLKLDIPKKKLSNCLEVLKKFKSCESEIECFEIPFIAWSKLEQLEEFLEHLVNGKKLEKDTIQYLEDKN